MGLPCFRNRVRWFVVLAGRHVGGAEPVLTLVRMVDCKRNVNAARRGLTGRRATIEVDGGMLEMDWRDDGHVMMVVKGTR